MSDNAEENQQPVPENITQDPQPEPAPIEGIPVKQFQKINQRMCLKIFGMQKQRYAQMNY